MEMSEMIKVRVDGIGDPIPLTDLAAFWVENHVSEEARPSSCFLVVEDPEKASTWHLPVKDTSGTPNHTLMGAAWAALHGGYRGNKYEGPDKDKAIAKLTALYKAEDMPLPTEEMSEMIKQEDGKWVLYSEDGSKKLGTYDSEEEAKKREDEVKMFKHMKPAEEQAQEPVLSDESVVEGEEGSVLMFGEGKPNGYDRGPVVMEVALIEPGWGNSKDNHYYPKATLERAAPMFKGIKMYSTNHVDAEHTVRNEVAEILDCPIRFTSTGAPVARVGVFDGAFAENVRNRAKLGTLNNLQCSILGDGKVKKDAMEEGGRKGHLVEDIVSIRSVDWVPRAGAGGRVLGLVEMEDKTVEKAEEIEKKEEEQKTVVEEIQEQKPVLLDASVVLPILTDSGLPAKTITRLAAKPWAKIEDVKAAVVEAQEVLAEVQEAGRPHNMGVTAPVKQPEPQRTQEEIIESERAILRKFGLVK